jgi:acetate kinase
MGNYLIINAGSTSLKYALLGGRDLVVQKQAVIENIGTKVCDHSRAFSMMLQALGEVKDLRAVGHRLVHGGAEFTAPTRLDNEIICRLEKYNELAPLHNPAGLACARAGLETFGREIPNVAVFDTAFYKDLPAVAYSYALPETLVSQYGIRRFGFHGLAHHSVCLQAADKLKKSLADLNLITVHLGGGASITAVRKGQAVDTSMGFTPTEGLVMMTRCGDIDPAIPWYLQKQAGLSAAQVHETLNTKSGLLGLTGIATGMLDILQAAKTGDTKARRALDLYAYRIKKYIGSYLAVLGNIDALVFTGAIGDGSVEIRRLVTKDLALLKNVPVLHFPPQEEQIIARQIDNFLSCQR